VKNENKIKIFLVDDDALFLKSLEIEFIHHTDFIVETFSTGELCIANLSKKPDVIILDYHLDGIDKNAMNGIETLDKIKEFNPDIPVVMLSSQDKIDVAISCMHHKAFDYVVKSETAFLRLQKNITAHFHFERIEKELNWYMARM
jgi:DNA-binding NarL/FixJ family response regulator